MSRPWAHVHDRPCPTTFSTRRIPVVNPSGTSKAWNCLTLKAARIEALRALGDIAKDELPDGEVRSFVIDIREGEGPIVLTASLSLRVEQKC